MVVQCVSGTQIGFIRPGGDDADEMLDPDDDIDDDEE